MKNKRIIDKLLGVFYPPICMFCKNPLPADGKDAVCKDCLTRLPYTKNSGCFEAFGKAAYLISPFYYKDGVKLALRDLKFKSKYSNAPVIAAFISGCLENIDEAKSADIIIPVPLSKKSYIKRGFNQSALLARSISERLGIPVDEDILIKTRETKRQSLLRGFEDRAKNVLGAFACTHALCGKTVLLTDDIYTTGMTVYNCAEALVNAGAKKVIAVTAATAHKEIGFSRHDYDASRLIFKK